MVLDCWLVMTESPIQAFRPQTVYVSQLFLQVASYVLGEYAAS